MLDAKFRDNLEFHVVDIYQNIKSLLGVEGIKLFHSAQEELLEFEERALEQAKGEDNG